MKENTLEWLSVAFSATMIITLLICAFVAAGQRDDLKQEAVDRGFAEWVVKGQDKTEFKWKEKQ